MTDNGLGRRLPAIVARRLAEIQDAESGRADVVKPKPAGAILIRGAEGVAVQLARCCRPIPGDPIVGIIRKGQGLEVHMHDCPQVRKLRSERDRWIDVEWEPASDRLFEVTLKVLTQNVRGVLGKVASAIAAQDCNIQNVSTESEQGTYASLFITVQVAHRLHLAKVVREVRNIPEVVRINRVKADQKAA